MAGKKPASSTNKIDESSKGSPGKSSLASDGVIIPSPKGSSADEFPPSEMTTEKLLQLVGALSLKEKFSFLEHFDLISKLEGKSPFSPEELEEIARERLRTDLIDESRFGKGEFFPIDIVGDPPNDDHGERPRDLVSPLDGIGFRPNKDNFLPRGEDGNISSSFPGDGLSQYHPDPNAGNSSKHVQFGQSNATSFRAYSPANSTRQSKSDPISTINTSKQTSGSPPTRGMSQGSSNTFVNTGNQYLHHPANSTQTYYTHPSHNHSHPYNNPHFNPQTHQPTHHNQSGYQPQFNTHSHQPTQQTQSTGQPHFHPQQQPHHHHNPANAPQMPRMTQYGFGIRAAPRPVGHSNYDNDRVIIRRNNRGTTPKERAKIRELCTTAITPQITQSNISKLLSSTTPNSYDIAEDASQWQTTLRAIHRHVVASDFKHIVMIPHYFDENDPDTVNYATSHANAVLDHDQLTDDHYKRYQRFLRTYGRDEELESDAWLEEKLWKSLSPALLAEVSSDFLELDKDEDPKLETCKGSLTLLRIIIKRVVQSNQEARRALEDYIKTFDIRKFPGENVTEASLRIKAVARSLGTNNLPSDIIHRVLEGFAHASTPLFQSFCATQESLITSSLVQDRLNNKQTLYKTLVDILADLEVRYVDLRSGQRWLGQGHGTTAVDSVFLSSTTTEDDDDSVLSDDHDYAVYVNTVGPNKAQPFDVWVRDKTCHHCGELGHIRPQCPNRHLAPVRRSNPRSQHDRHRSGRGGGYEHRSSSRPSYPPHQRNTTSYPADTKKYVKKVLTAALDMVEADDSNHSTTSADNASDDKPSTSENSSGPTPDIGSKYAAFLAALGCPKE